MEEIMELRRFIEEQRYDDALLLIGEMEDMATSDKFVAIKSHATILLIHLIKQATEKRTTRSWETSIKNALDSIADVNKRRKAGGFYLLQEDVVEALERAFDGALRRAALEAFEGVFLPEELQKKFDKQSILQQALTLVLNEQATRI
jgi:uncharacterized protein YdeI (YjbR/CyaY-like superfamily)